MRFTDGIEYFISPGVADVVGLRIHFDENQFVSEYKIEDY